MHCRMHLLRIWLYMNFSLSTNIIWWCVNFSKECCVSSIEMRRNAFVNFGWINDNFRHSFWSQGYLGYTDKYIEVHVSVIKGFKIGQNKASIVFRPSCKILLFAKSVDPYIPSYLTTVIKRRWCIRVYGQLRSDKLLLLTFESVEPKIDRTAGSGSKKNGLSLCGK